MSTIGGLLFLFGGITLFVVSILFLMARDRATRTPKQTVAHFQRSRTALGKIHRVQVTLRESSRARARAMHPSGRSRRHRRSA